MPRRISEQRNSYRGDPRRAFIRLTLCPLKNAEREVVLLADTGNPCPIIVSAATLADCLLEETAKIMTNFGPITGGWSNVKINKLGFDERVRMYGSDDVVAAVRESDPIFQGLAGLPLLRMLEYGGDSQSFWLRAARQTHKQKKR